MTNRIEATLYNNDDSISTIENSIALGRLSKPNVNKVNYNPVQT